jgi:hypothetical protein
MGGGHVGGGRSAAFEYSREVIESHVVGSILASTIRKIPVHEQSRGAATLDVANGPTKSTVGKLTDNTSLVGEGAAGECQRLVALVLDRGRSLTAQLYSWLDIGSAAPLDAW